MPKPIKFTVYVDQPDGSQDEVVHELPAVNEVCSACNGEGKSSSHLGAFTREEMDEQGYEFYEDYMSGFYDKQCDVCHGDRVVAVVDEKRADPEILKQYEEWCQGEAEYRQMCEMERRMGA